MSDWNHTIAAISTPPGKGGIGIVRISGPEAVAIAKKVFIPKNSGKSLDDLSGYSALFGYFYSDGEKIDEGVLINYRAPHSYTGENVVELSCHGGEIICRQLLNSCLKAGAQPAGRGEFTRRAVVNGRMDLSRAEAVMDMISASSRQQAAFANANLSGKLSAEIERQKQSLIGLVAHLTALIDFPEEGVDEVSRAEYLRTIVEVKTALAELVRNYERAAVFRRGIQAVIIGSPNVGKSTFFNLMAGFERAIVTPVAGTTRDVISQEILIGGIPVEIADTAGLRKTEDIVEMEGIRRSRQEMEKAALVIAVFDGSRELAQEDWDLIHSCAGKPALGLINKEDLGQQVQPAELAPYFSDVLQISARVEASREKVEQAVKSILDIEDLDENAAMLANERQLSCVFRAVESLQLAEDGINNEITYDAVGVCVDDALQALGELTGEDISEAILEEVFSKFCVGK